MPNSKTPKEVIKILEKKGFYIHHQHGSHITLKSHFDPTKRITVPFHNKDLKVGTLLSILKQAGIGKKDL